MGTESSARAVGQGAAARAGTTLVLGLPWETPPLSLNDRYANRIVESKAIAKVRESAGWIAKQARLGTHDHVRVTLHYRPLRRGRRDADNLVGTLKPVCDGLVDAGLVPDDTPEHMAKEMPVIHEPDGIRRALWLTIDVLSDSPAAAGSQPTTVGDPLDWHRIAVQIARYGGSYHGLTTRERDAVEDAVKGIQEQEWGTDWERRTDAADQGER